MDPMGTVGPAGRRMSPAAGSVRLDDISAHAFLTKLAFPWGKRALKAFPHHHPVSGQIVGELRQPERRAELGQREAAWLHRELKR